MTPCDGCGTRKPFPRRPARPQTSRVQEERAADRALCGGIAAARFTFPGVSRSHEIGISVTFADSHGAMLGVLRSLGARKMDIRNLFNAETFMIGLASGVFGVVVAYIFSGIISAVLFKYTGIAGMATLAPLAAFVMICVSVILTLISGLIPAQAAAKKDPVIALRTE